MLCALVALVIASWQIAAVVVFVASLRHRFYVEGIAVGYVFDVWYGPTGAVGGVIAVCAIVALGEVFARAVALRRS